MSNISVNGCSITTTPGSESWELYRDRVTKKRRCQYDYRDTDGELFSCVKDDLETCRKARDAWLVRKPQGCAAV